MGYGGDNFAFKHRPCKGGILTLGNKISGIYNPFKIWVKDTGPVLTTMNVNYDLTANHSNPVALFPVNLVPLTEAPPFPGFKGFYASTFESGWEQYGTVLPGEPGLYPIGNPWWVSFHINVPDTYHDWLVYSIYDECVPEPATMCLLGLGGLALIRKRRA